MNCSPVLFEDLFANELPVLRTFFGGLKDRSLPSFKGAQLGVNLYEDEQSFVAEVPVPGVAAEQIKITFEKGGVAIEAKNQEEKKDVKYYYKSASNYSYWIPLPAGKIDENASPEAVCKDGILKLSFQKNKPIKPMKIEVKKG